VVQKDLRLIACFIAFKIYKTTARSMDNKMLIASLSPIDCAASTPCAPTRRSPTSNYFAWLHLINRGMTATYT
jgi:hypothetical protein